MIILIVDDEPIHKRNFASLLRKLDSSSQILEAGDGIQALSILNNTEVDLVITDIQMPNMDGLQLLEKVNEYYPQIKVIILSVYSEFTYAKQAIKNGAVDYILKPVIPKEVKASIDKVVKIIDDEKKQQLKLNEAVSQNLDYMLNHAILGADEIEIRELEQVFPKASSGYVMLFLHSKGQFYTATDIEKLLKIARENIHLEDVYAFRLINQEEAVVMLVFSEVEPDQDQLMGIQEKFEFGLGNKCQISIGSMQLNLIRQLKDSFSDAVFADKFHFYQSGYPISFQYLKYSHQHLPSQMNELDNKIFELMIKDDVNNAYQVYEAFLRPLVQKNPQYHPDVVRQACAFILNTVYLKAENMLNENQKGNIVININKMQSDSSTYVDLLQRSQTILSLIFEGLNLQKNSISKDRMTQIRKYIVDHYMDDLTLDAISNRFYFNASYLSTLFKSNFGHSFSDYLANERINASKVLLKNPNYKVNDVAKLVGYKDSSYFSRVFKKKVGFSPDEYRRMSIDG